MSQLKQIVVNALKIKSVSPEVISNVDVLIHRSILRLQSQDLLPPRTIEFKSLDEKQEKRDGNDLVYNFYYLPKDFRKLDEFRPFKTYPYQWEADEYELYEDNITKKQNQDRVRRRFTIINTNQTPDSKSEKILIASPFPDDDETIQIKYYVNGKGVDWDWLDEDYYEAVIADVEKMVGLRSPQDVEADERISDAVERSRELKDTGKVRTLQGGFFGKRGRNFTGRHTNKFGNRNN